jgi:hypothetical protein
MSGLALIAAAFFLQTPAVESGDLVRWNEEGAAFHRERRLTEASERYTRVLKADPPRELTASEKALVRTSAPVLRVHPREPFALKDAAAILHPSGEWIAYHLFWEDDIDFPDDNDPCDHEVVYVRLREGKPVEHWTYFHGRLLRAANPAIGPAIVNVQWGKHGSIPAGGEYREQLKAEQDRTWKRLSTVGRQDADSPLGRGWPLKYEGSRESFDDYSRTVDLMETIEKSGYWLVSRWNNATINRYFLRYNFAAKTEWPAIE